MIKRIISALLLLVFSVALFGCTPTIAELEPQTVDEEHFTVLSISEVIHQGESAARISIISDVDISYYYLMTSLVGADGNALIDHEQGVKETVKAGATFSVYVSLGETEFSEISSVRLEGYGKSLTPEKVYKVLEGDPRVTFMCNSVEWAKQTAPNGEPIPCPDTPIIPGYTFEGWYTDEAYTTPFDFARGASADSVVYAKLTEKSVPPINDITKQVMTSAITVRSTYTEDRIWNAKTTKSTSSGVIIRMGSVAYVLTNHHSVTLLEGYKKIEIEVEDCFGTVYPASVVASDVSYDLAILEVRGMSDNLTAIELGTTDPEIGEEVYSIGSPAGQKNAITVGEITKYCGVTLATDKYLSNVAFDVIAHTAEVRHGSSGGALINSNFELVGINYAGKDGDDFSSGYAIPIEKIHEFIEKYM